jgi:hypothetical protein
MWTSAYNSAAHEDTKHSHSRAVMNMEGLKQQYRDRREERMDLGRKKGKEEKSHTARRINDIPIVRKIAPSSPWLAHTCSYSKQAQHPTSTR